MVTLAVYWQVSNHDFVGFDDKSYVTGNHHVQSGLTSESVFWPFSLAGKAYWHPLTWFSHMLDCQLFGLNPKGHHLTNLLFHLANTLLLFFVFRRMTGCRWRSALVAALFALHPLNVEAVAWIAERKSVLSTSFWMLTMMTYFYFTERPTLLRYMLVFSVYGLGLMAKPMLVTLPFVLLLLDYWPLDRVGFLPLEGKRDEDVSGLAGADAQRIRVSRLVLQKVPLLALSLLSVYLTLLSARYSLMAISTEVVPMKLRIANALVSYVSYIAKMIWPHKLAVFYPFPTTLPTWQPVVSGLLLICVSILVLRQWRRTPYLAVGWLWYLGTLVPVIGLKQAGLWPAMADRWTYVPLIGLFIMIAWGVPGLLVTYRHRKVALSIAASAVLSALMIVTWKQLPHWRNTITLFQHAINVTEKNYVAHTNVGHALSDQGKLKEAIPHFIQAVKIKPTSSKAHSNLGRALARQGRNAQAVVHLSEALELDPHSPGIHNNLGNVLERQGKIQEALVHYSTALQLEPRFAEAHFNLGTFWARQGRNEEGMAHFSKALQFKPDFAAAHNSFGVVLARQGNLQEAIYHFGEAVRLEPDFVRAQNNLRTALKQTKQSGKKP
jgi:Flp pilus assembly protein TadD